jgi:hypothetical protein
VDEVNMSSMLDQYFVDRMKYEKELHNPALQLQRVRDKIVQDEKQSNLIARFNLEKARIDNRLYETYGEITRADYLKACGVNKKPRVSSPELEYCMDHFDIPKYPNRGAGAMGLFVFIVTLLMCVCAIADRVLAEENIDRMAERIAECIAELSGVLFVTTLGICYSVKLYFTKR